MRKSKQFIIEEGKKRFQQILEYTYTAPMSEAGEDGEDAPDMGGDPNAMGGGPMGGAPDMGGDPNAMGGGPMGGDPNAMGGGPEGFNPQGADMGGDPSMMPDMGSTPGMDTAQPDDEVVDVSELTDAQEETEEKVDKLDSRFDKVLKAIGQFEELIRQNDEKLDNLKAEFEKRNPTQIEKLSMQTAKSYPFNVTPESYWKEKEATSNYSVEDDDNGKEQGQYAITADDVKGIVDWKSIADSLDDEDWIYNQNLNNLMKI